MNNLLTLPLAIVDLKNGEPIFYQVFRWMLLFYTSPTFKSWSDHHDAKMPHLPFQMARFGEQALVSLAKAGTHLSVAGPLKANKLADISLRHFITAVTAIKDIKALF